MKHYGLASIFDAYYTATALKRVSDHTMISTDNIFDTVPGVRGLDPRDLMRRDPYLGRP